MKKLLMIVAMLVVGLSISLSQSMKFGYDGPFPPDSNGYKLIGGIVNNGIGVDPAGKVWIQTRSENTTRDSIATPEGGKARLFPILVFNPNGTQASFSPIKILTGPDQNNVTVTDTMIRSTATGGSIDRKTGNFTCAWGSLAYKPGPLIWQINYRTGQGARRTLLPLGTLQNNLASVALDQDGEYFACSVLGGSPGIILNPDGSSAGTFAAGVSEIGRTIAVSADGNDVYCPKFAGAKTYIYHSDNGSLGPYVLKDSILVGVSVESAAFNPKTGYFWFSVDRRTTALGWNANTYYGWNPTTKAIVDSFQVKAWDQSGTGPLPRGMAFSPTGDTVYVSHFDVSSLPGVLRFVANKAVSVEREKGTLPTDYALSQNYPNPFNPSTQISFSITKSGATTLKVYDLMGREVSTLVNETLAPGAYSVKFDATNLSSGTYVYVLTSGATRLTNKMLLLK